MRNQKKIDKSKQTEKLNKEKLLQIAKFFGILIGIIASYYVVVIFFNTEIFQPYIHSSAYLSGMLIKIFDSSTTIDASIITTDKISIILAFGCEGSEALVIFLAGVVAFPTNFKHKLKGIIIGGTALYILNLIRILILFFVASLDGNLFDIFHSEILPVLFILISLIAWYLWLKMIPEKK